MNNSTQSFSYNVSVASEYINTWRVLGWIYIVVALSLGLPFVGERLKGTVQAVVNCISSLLQWVPGFKEVLAANDDSQDSGGGEPKKEATEKEEANKLLTAHDSKDGGGDEKKDKTNKKEEKKKDEKEKTRMERYAEHLESFKQTGVGLCQATAAFIFVAAYWSNFKVLTPYEVPEDNSKMYLGLEELEDPIDDECYIFDTPPVSDWIACTQSQSDLANSINVSDSIAATWNSHNCSEYDLIILRSILSGQPYNLDHSKVHVSRLQFMALAGLLMKLTSALLQDAAAPVATQFEFLSTASMESISELQINSGCFMYDATSNGALLEMVRFAALFQPADDAMKMVAFYALNFFSFIWWFACYCWGFLGGVLSWCFGGVSTSWHVCWQVMGPAWGAYIKLCYFIKFIQPFFLVIAFCTFGLSLGLLAIFAAIVFVVLVIMILLNCFIGLAAAAVVLAMLVIGTGLGFSCFLGVLFIVFLIVLYLSTYSFIFEVMAFASFKQTIIFGLQGGKLSKVNAVLQIWGGIVHVFESILKYWKLFQPCCKNCYNDTDATGKSKETSTKVATTEHQKENYTQMTPLEKEDSARQCERLAPSE